MSQRMPGRADLFSAAHQYINGVLQRNLDMDTVRDPNTRLASAWTGEEEIFPKEAKSIKDVMDLFNTKLDTGGT